MGRLSWPASKYYTRICLAKIQTEYLSNTPNMLSGEGGRKDNTKYEENIHIYYNKSALKLKSPREAN